MTAGVQASGPAPAGWTAGELVPPPCDVLGRLTARGQAGDLEAEALVVRREHGPALRWTYAELEQEVARRAGVLRGAGIVAGDRVLLVTARLPGLVPALLALLRLGAAYVPVDPAAPGAHWRTVADAVGARALVGPAAALDKAADVLAPGTLLLDVDGAAGELEVPAAEAHDDAGATAYVLFTSGSTGAPKGVVVSHANVAHRLASYLALTDGPCRYLLHSSLCFDGAVGGMFSTLARGGCLVLVPDPVAADPARAARAVREERVTHLEPVPAWYAALLEVAEPGDLTGLRAVVLGGDVLPPELVALSRQALPGVRLFNDYGPTEVTVAATVFEVDDRWDGGDVPIGRPHVNTSVAVLDDALQPVAPGEVGELWVAGPCIAQGYVGQAEHPSFRQDPGTGARQYRTGDLVRWDEHGLLHFEGRRDRQVKVRGQRIEPEEVEAALLGQPGVATAAVQVDRDGPEPRLVAYAAPLPGAALDADAVLRRLADRLPSHLVPALVLVLPALPLTPGGKVDRRALPAAPCRATSGEAPRGAHETAVAQAFAAVLGVPVDRETDFFGAGGQSLGAARVVARLRSALGVDLELSDLAAAHTPSALGAVLRGRPPARPEPVLTRAPRPADAVWRLPAAPRQESFWYLEHVGGGLGRSNLVEVLTFPPRTDPALLHRAVQVLLDRHAALRTAFELAPEGLFQRVEPHAEAPLVELPAVDDAAALDALADAFGAEPFDLSSAPLLRAGLVPTADGPALVLVVHHAVADGWSLDLLVGELSAVVRAGGDASALPRPAVEYADLVEWTAGRSPARRAAAEEHLTQVLLRGAEHGGQLLPFDRPAPPQADTRGGLVTGRIPAQVFSRVRDLAAARGTTAYVVLTASLGALLARSAGQSQAVLSGPLSGRGDPALDRVVGCCIGTGLFPVDVSGAPTFAELVDRVAQESTAGAAHTWLPLEVPMRRLEDGLRAQAAPVLLNLLETAAADVTDPAASVHRRSRPSPMAYADLDVYLVHRDGGLSVAAVHALARLDGDTVQGLLDRWLHLLGVATQDPGCPVAALPLLTAADEARLDAWEGDAGEPLGTGVLQAFSARVAQDPRAVAVVDASGPWTREQLWRRSGAVAGLLHERGLGPGDAAVLALDETADAVAALIACWRAGVVPVPVGESQPDARVEDLARAAGARLVLTRSLLDGVDRPADPAAAPAGAAAYVLYTSGSTGEPKGVVVSAAALAASTWARLQAYPAGPGVALLAHDLAFDAGLGIVAWCLTTGGVLVMSRHDERLDPRLLAGLVQRHRVEQLDIVPSHYRLLLDLAGPGQLDTLTLVTLGGEACPPSLVQAHRRLVPGAALVNEYGPTESTVWALAHSCSERDETAERVPIGRPVAGVTARVGDVDGKRVPPGAEGELLLSGHLLADGYLGDPGTTAARFVEHGGRRWYRTGDRARWTAAAEVDFLGRHDTQLTIRGYRVEREEVEIALAGLDAVARAVADVRELVAGSPVLVAWVQLAAGAQVDQDLSAHLRDLLLERLPEWLVPSLLVVVDDLPETTSGKVDRARLPTPEHDRLPAGSAPETVTEQRVAAVWEELLGRPVPTDQSFFALGGQSLLAARMVARLRQEFQVELPLRDVLAAPRVREVAALLDGHDAAATAPARDIGAMDLGEVEDLLSRVDELTDDEVEAALARLERG